MSTVVRLNTSAIFQATVLLSQHGVEKARSCSAAMMDYGGFRLQAIHRRKSPLWTPRAKRCSTSFPNSSVTDDIFCIGFQIGNPHAVRSSVAHWMGHLPRAGSRFLMAPVRPQSMLPHCGTLTIYCLGVGER